MSAHGMSTILAASRVDWARTFKQSTSLSVRPSSLPSPTRTNSTVTFLPEFEPEVFMLNSGKILAMAAAEAKTSFFSQATWKFTNDVH